MQSCLWLARTLPFPLTAGDRIYSGKLAASLAAQGVAVTYVGFAGEAAAEPADNVTWHIVPGRPYGQFASLFSILPLVGARHATRQYRTEIARLLDTQAWDIIVIDQYGMGWVLDCIKHAKPGTRVFMDYDHEESVTRQQWIEAGSASPKGLYLLQNYLKTRRLERRTLRACDVVSAITAADAKVFQRLAPDARVVTLTPGYGGPRLGHREITDATPRAAVMFGSYRWSAKQANLKLFLEQANDEMHAAEVELRVVGDMDEAQRLALQKRYASTCFTGFVQDPTPYLDARLAIVAEPIGGGFKLKFLDYIFNRLPVVALEACVAGLPDKVLQHMLVVPDMAALTACVISVIDDVERLDQLQQNAFRAAEQTFNWADRGADLQAAIRSVGRGSAAPTVLRHAAEPGSTMG
jgi:glycosyltransferase involved in cell wall biosynthesis